MTYQEVLEYAKLGFKVLQFTLTSGQVFDGFISGTSLTMKGAIIQVRDVGNNNVSLRPDEIVNIKDNGSQD